MTSAEKGPNKIARRKTMAANPAYEGGRTKTKGGVGVGWGGGGGRSGNEVQVKVYAKASALRKRSASAVPFFFLRAEEGERGALYIRKIRGRPPDRHGGKPAAGK
jgi:hypothetical protein